MSDRALYAFADSACIEALVGRFPAWPHVVAPVPYSLHLANYQMKVLESYLANPELHEKACANPKLRGGAFVCVSASSSSQVQALFNKMREGLKDNMAFAQALNATYASLVSEANGESLEPRYAALPDPLRGYVELIYDYFNHPILRCLEGSLYKSPYYKRDLQSLHLFALACDDARPYYMSTPRFSSDRSIDWSVPFDDPRLDRLFELDDRPKPLAEICELIGVGPEKAEALRALLRETDQKADMKWRGEGVRVRYVGHACALLETKDVSILVDPLIAPKPDEMEVDRFSFGDLPERIDYALVTHGHHDHFVIETLLRLRRKIDVLVVPKNCDSFYADFSLKLLAKSLGFRKVEEVDCLDEIRFVGGRIVAVPFLGEHNDLAGAKSAYLVEAAGRSLLFAADSNCLDPAVYDRIRDVTGRIETLFVGMECVGAPLSWVYGPLLPVKTEHKHSQQRRSNGCNAANALKLAQALDCARAYVYAVGREPWIKHLLALDPSEHDVYMSEIKTFIEGLRSRGVEAKRLFGKTEIHL
jgi:L-ascorbate metabolism protein UlaG (beta-lactamase superfamily)